MTFMLSITNLHAGYGSFDVLKGIDLSVRANEIVALIGPNGAGKSTVIKSVFSLASVSEGSILFRGQEITRLRTHELMELGISYVNQGRINFGNLTVRENLEIGADLIHDSEVIGKNLEMVYAKFPVLREREKDKAYGLSGGQQQQLALGRALMQSPALLMLDEPSLGLSPILQKEIFQTIQKLKEDGISLLIVEQNARKAIEIADRTYLLEDGRIALEGGPEILEQEEIKNVYLGGRY
jgi:branched-chain amino acid transport system ATP-binding protein